MNGFEEIYNQYFKDVYLYLRGLTLNEALAEELTEETFFKAMGAINKFKGNCEIRVWLCQIAKNNYYTYLKKHKNILSGRELGSDIAETQENIEKLLVVKDEAFKIHKLLHNMNEPYKEVFSLRVFGELSFKQIGALFERNEHWACITYHRAKEKLQKRMEE